VTTPWPARARAEAQLRRARAAWESAGLDVADLAEVAREVLDQAAPPTPATTRARVGVWWAMRDEVARLEVALDAERHRRALAEARARCYLEELDARDGLRQSGERAREDTDRGQRETEGGPPDAVEGEGSVSLTAGLVDAADLTADTVEPSGEVGP
jgi:hypothetical protein